MNVTLPRPEMPSLCPLKSLCWDSPQGQKANKYETKGALLASLGLARIALVKSDGGLTMASRQ
jgi:hypothetical protein